MSDKHAITITSAEGPDVVDQLAGQEAQKIQEGGSNEAKHLWFILSPRSPANPGSNQFKFALKAWSNRENDLNEVPCPPSWTVFAAVGGLLSRFYRLHSGHRVQIQNHWSHAAVYRAALCSQAAVFNPFVSASGLQGGEWECAHAKRPDTNWDSSPGRAVGGETDLTDRWVRCGWRTIGISSFLVFDNISVLTWRTTVGSCWVVLISFYFMRSWF